MTNVAWTALAADPKRAAAFATDFRQLTEKAIELGSVSSAAMLGNLVGDLENEGKENTCDFELACDAFERALDNYAGPERGPVGLEMDWAKVTINWMRRVFQPKLAAVAKRKAPESYQRLEKALNVRDLAVVETAEFRQTLKARENARREAEKRAQMKALAPRITELKKFVTKVLTTKANRWQRDQFETEVRNALKSWEGVVLYTSGIHYMSGLNDELKQIAELKVSISDLQNDPRIGWTLASGLAAWLSWDADISPSGSKPSKDDTKKMERYFDHWVVKKRMGTVHDHNVKNFTNAVDRLIRYDETAGKFLVRAAALKDAKRAATNGYNGAIWMTTLAEIVVAVESEEAITFDDDGKPLELNNTGLTGYLLSLKVDLPKMKEKDLIDFDELFPQYIAAVRAGNDPGQGLGDQGYNFFRNRKKRNP